MPPTVWYLGLTSLLTDLSSEMVTSVLPLFLVVQLSVSPFAFGALDGLYNGVAALTRWGGGIAADRWRRHKEIAVLGYTLSAACRLGLLAAGRNIWTLGALIATDRIGKGIRTIPRDALISLSSSREQLAHSFGVHRALDATGAMLGPLCAFALLAAVPGAFDVVFIASFSIGIVGLAVLVLFVDNIIPPRDQAEGENPSFHAAVGLLRVESFRSVVLVASGLALGTISDAFVYLALREQLGTQMYVFPLLYVGTASFYLLLAIPFGRLADRGGRARIFVATHCALLAVYALLLLPLDHPVAALLTVGLLGAYYAGTDGVMVALASGQVPDALRGSGLALLTTATSGARFAASLTFGWLWTVGGRDLAITCFAAALAVGLLVAAVALRRGRLVDA